MIHVRFWGLLFFAHQRATGYYVDSIKRPRFTARRFSMTKEPAAWH